MLKALRKERKKLEEAAGQKVDAKDKKKGKKGEVVPRGNAGARILLEKL
jgi:pumilio family protein 6